MPVTHVDNDRLAFQSPPIKTPIIIQVVCELWHPPTQMHAHTHVGLKKTHTKKNAQTCKQHYPFNPSDQTLKVQAETKRKGNQAVVEESRGLWLSLLPAVRVCMPQPEGT